MEKQSDVVKERLRASELFDYYGELLKEGQRELCSRYLLDDLSLSEIAENLGISRQGVHDSLKRSIKQMEGFEEKLHLIEKSKKLEKELFRMKMILKEMSQTEGTYQMKEAINIIEELV